MLAGLFHPERYDRETSLDPEQVAASLRSDGVSADYIPEIDAIVEDMVRDAGAGDILLVMSNGSFGGIHDKLLTALGRVTAPGGAPSGSDPQGFSQ